MVSGGTLSERLKRDHDPFGAAADGAPDVQLGLEAAAARQDEGAQRRQVLIHQVHFGFELGDFGLGDARLARMDVLGKSRENRAEIEELVLHAQEDGGQQGQSRLLDGELVDGGARGSQKDCSVHRPCRRPRCAVPSLGTRWPPTRPVSPRSPWRV